MLQVLTTDARTHLLPKCLQHIPFFKNALEEFDGDTCLPVPLTEREFLSLVDHHDPLSNLLRLLEVSDRLCDDTACESLIEKLKPFSQEEIVERDPPHHILGWILSEKGYVFEQDPNLDERIHPWLKTVTGETFPTRESFHKWFPLLTRVSKFILSYHGDTLWQHLVKYYILNDARITHVHNESYYGTYAKRNLNKISGMIDSRYLLHTMQFNPDIQVYNMRVDSIYYADFIFEHILTRALKSRSSFSITTYGKVPDKYKDYFSVQVLEKGSTRHPYDYDTDEEREPTEDFVKIVKVRNDIEDLFELPPILENHRPFEDCVLNLQDDTVEGTEIEYRDLIAVLELHPGQIRKVNVSMPRYVGCAEIQDDFKLLRELLLEIPDMTLKIKPFLYSPLLKSKFAKCVRKAGFYLRANPDESGELFIRKQT